MLCPLATKLGRPVFASSQVLRRYRPSRVLDGLDKVLERQQRLEKLFRLDLVPRHLDRVWIAGRTGRQPFLTVERDLLFDLSDVAGPERSPLPPGVGRETKLGARTFL